MPVHERRVAWLCWRVCALTPLLFSRLDARCGGGFSVGPARRDARVVSRRYHPRSLVLETIWEVGAARLTVEDALALAGGPQLVRNVLAHGQPIDAVVALCAP